MNKIKIPLAILCVILLIACNNNKYSPKRYQYFRIDIPQAEYKTCNEIKECSFLISKYAVINHSDNTWAKKSDQWFNISYPAFNADIHISYKKIKPEEFYEVSEESRTLAYKHTARASSINESFFANDTSNVYGVLYEMGGASASQVQFFMTDSTENFLRGSLYFNNIPNADSISPVNTFITQDIIRLVETIKWKN